MRVAIVKAGKIINVVVADSGEIVPAPEGCGVVELEDPDAGIGWTWDQDCWIPPASASLPLPVTFTPLDLIGPGGLLTDQEKAAIFTAARTDLEVEIWLAAMLSASEIRADDPRTVQGFAFAVSRGLLTSERVANILGGDGGG